MLFLGDAGYYINTGAVKGAATFTLAVPILILGVPILDTFLLSFEKQKPPTSILCRPRTSSPPSVRERILQRKAVVLFYGISIFFGLIAILINNFVQNSTYSHHLLLFLFAFFWQWGKNLGVLDLPGGKKTVEKS